MQVYSLPYTLDPTDLLAGVQHLPGASLLQSGDRRHYQSRFDIVVADPLAFISLLNATPNGPTLRLHGTHQPVLDIPAKQPLIALDHALTTLRPANLSASPANVPITAGFVGLFGYGLHSYLEQHAPAPADPTSLPNLLGGYYDWSVITDHYQRTTTLYSHRNKNYSEKIASRLNTYSPPAPKAYSGALSPFAASSTDTDYATAFNKIQHYIVAGDCYQTNLARHFKATIRPAESLDLYKQLQRAQGGAFSAYLTHPSGHVLCLSPERLARRYQHGDRQIIETCPIKGTAPRSSDPQTDQALANELSANMKNRAENLMIVDLLRNDLGRIARTGSVRVESLFALVSLPNVHHLVSTISAEIGPDQPTALLLRALLPGGSITGAPKIRAIDIINEVETTGRSAYCGSLGYIDHSGKLDLNIAIRSLVLEPNGDLHLWGGGAIVADSDLRLEAAEIRHKIGGLMALVDGADA